MAMTGHSESQQVQPWLCTLMFIDATASVSLSLMVSSHRLFTTVRLRDKVDSIWRLRNRIDVVTPVFCLAHHLLHITWFEADEFKVYDASVL
ncbi:hypothetical protein M404DRAFT_997026 [Pisolithus tinctorius Marx 270]|uniref:Uncharacterized protein n=1 Tax=Pisolithus tinctorius Marx 270 TaxID=870435 RepID=A0A0C3PKP7_PISTI|nr:hypothetical protein M404DRAFT_997026 [Pisolithus tinctorius Marx 270]